MATWEPWVLAAVAPAVVWLLWRAQTLSVELLRLRLAKLTRTRSQTWLYNTVSWFGVLVHELSHATVLVLSGHGLKTFRVGVEQGHVEPARSSRGAWSFLSYLAAALAPLFLPPLLFLVAVRFALGARLPLWPSDGPHMSEPTVAATRTVLAGLADFPVALARLLAGLDVATWQGALVLLAALLLMPAGRPSHVKGSRFHGERDEGDVAVIRRRIRRNPAPFLVFLAFIYLAYLAAVAWGPDAAGTWYWRALASVWATALAGVVLALAGALWWTLVALDGRVRALLAPLPPLLAVAVQVAARALDPDSLPELALVNAASLVVWLAAALALGAAFPRQRRIPRRSRI